MIVDLLLLGCIGVMLIGICIWVALIFTVPNTRSQEHQRQAERRAKGLGRGVDVHTDFSLTKRNLDHA